MSDTVTTIGDYAFSGCTGLKEINMSNNITSIGSYAFNGCGSIKSITLPQKLQNMGIFAFNSCTSLENISIPSDVTSISEKTFNNCTSLVSVVLPEGIRTLGASSFRGCSSLENINLPDSITFIGEFSFSVCGNLVNPKLPKGLKSLEKASFKDCSSITSIDIPENVDTIGEKAFLNCTNLDNIYIPDTVKNIAEDAFDGCDNMEIITPKGSYAEGYAKRKGINIKNYSIIDANVVLSKETYVYNGKAIIPDITVTYNGCILANGTDYAITCENNVNVGTATVVITGIGKYTGTVTKTFNIVSSDVKEDEEKNIVELSKVKLLKQQKYAKKYIKLSWKKVNDAEGYEVYRANSKKGTYKLVKTTNKISYKNSKLKAGKNYFYKVRAYKTVNGKKIFGPWSNVKAYKLK